MVCFLALAAFGSGRLNFDVQFRAIANLTYELDVVSGRLSHDAPGNYRKVWEERFLRTPADRSALDLWRTRRNAPGKTLDAAEPDPTVRFPIEWVGRYVDPDSYIRGAGFEATSLADYRRRILLATNRETAKDLAYVVAHFLSDFEDWWRTEPTAQGTAFVNGLKSTLQSPKVQTSLAQFMQFYRPQLPGGYTVPFVLLYRPNAIKEPTSGQQLAQYAVVQFLPGEKPEQRMDVVLHELAHFLYGSAAARDLAALQRRFIATNRPGAVPAYNLLNESLATALGNGVIGESFADPTAFSATMARPLSLYNNPDIDRGGKAVFSWIKPFLASGGSLYDAAFVPRYLASIEAAFGDSLTRPAAYLSRLCLVFDEGIPDIPRGLVPQKLRTSSLWTSVTDLTDRQGMEGYFGNPSLSGLFVVTPGRLVRLRELGVLSEADYHALTAAPGPAVYGVRRNANALSYVVVATSAAEVSAAVDRIAGLRSFSPGLVP